jgi:hypothetical protein
MLKALRWLCAIPLVALACSGVATQTQAAAGAESGGASAPGTTTKPAEEAPADAESTRAAEGAPADAPGAQSGSQEAQSKPSKAGEAVPAKESKREETPTDACPVGMVLVEGEYCTSGGQGTDQNAVKHECVSEWYAPQNKKRVCEEFQPKAECTGKKVAKRYCIDQYAWPNQKGERPEVMNRFHQAQVKCVAEGKRLCTESEWTFACEGPDMKPFPYGFKRDTSKCHGDVEWDGPNMKKVAQRDPQELARLWKGVRSGSQPECKSEFGVYDLPGNTDEVVASETFESGWRGKYDSVHTGGPWYKGVRNQCRPKIYTHDEGFYYYFLSFRCCAEPDGAPTEPLTPKQRREGWDMKRVERTAGVSVEEMKEVLRKKRSGQKDCGCKDSDTRCRTLCGTLLGPEAQDFKR